MLPTAFQTRMKQMLGEESDAFFETFSKPPRHGLRINPLKKEALRIPERWADCGLSRIPWADNAYFYPQEPAEKEDAFRPGRHPFHEAGGYYIQEPSAMAAVPYLNVQPGDLVLDLCAAPGGKSTQLAGYLKGKGLLVSNEIIPSRAKILSENIERMGIRNAIVLNEDPQHLADHLAGFFDRILVDAPCSGEGMFRKNEDAVGEWSPENVEKCARRQDMILDCAASLLAPKGRIVYSTCTFAPEEDEGSVTRFLQRHPDFTLVPVPLSEGFSHGEPRFYPQAPQEIDRTIRLWPHKINGEGHFIAVLERGSSKTEVLPPERRLSSSRFQKGAAFSSCPQLCSFLKETLRNPNAFAENGKLLSFGDQLYLLPEYTPSLKGLKVLRPGLHLGTLLKNRFEPSHALALALEKEDVLRSMDLPTGTWPEGPAAEFSAADFIRGGTVRTAGEKGWTLITTCGMSLGWGKMAGGTLKNHYPKGLRR